MACVELCRARVECTTCGRIKAPRGRDVAPEAANGMCTYDCPGYADAPAAGHLWPNEPLTDEYVVKPEATPTPEGTAPASKERG